VRRVAPLLLVLLVWPSSARAWGFAAHRVVEEKATGTLPPPLGELFVGNASWLSAHAVDPDLWVRAGRSGEGPGHYLNLDAFGPASSFEVPATEAEYLRRHGEKARAQGRLPWRVGEVYRELVAAFRAGDAARVLERAAVLGHYAADAHVPLHAVTNYDGQLTGQTGLHSRWETVLFARFARQLEPEIAPGPAHRIEDPVAFAFDRLREDARRAAEVLAADLAARGPVDYVETAEDDRYDDAYYSRLFEREGPAMATALAAAAETVGSLWLSAWEEAGRPGLDWAFRFPYVRGRSRLVVALFEGMGATLVEEAAGRGALPHLDALRREGTTARLIPPFPARRAAAQATLFTGAWPSGHEVRGDGAPRASGSVLATDGGERSTALGAEPLWVSAARQGLPTVVVGVRQSVPFAPFLADKRFGGNFGPDLLLVAAAPTTIEPGILTGSDLVPVGLAEASLAPGTASREVRFTVGPVAVSGLLLDDPDDPTSGFDTLALSPAGDPAKAVRLKPRPGDDAFAALHLDTPNGPTWVHFRLFALSPDGRDLVLWHSGGARTMASRALVAEAVGKEGGLLPGGAARLYAQGTLGSRLWEGGDGTAERRYLETVRLAVRQHARMADLVLDHTRWSLAVLALPLPEETLRLWRGRLDPGLPGYDPALASRLRPFLDEALRLADAWVGEVARHVPDDAALAVVSDRGLGGVDRVVRPNVALAAAGLLGRNDDGTVDLSRTRAVYPPANAGFVTWNRASRAGGIVSPREEPRLRVATIAAMGGMRDPVSGDVVLAELLEPGRRGRPVGVGGSGGGDLYLRPAKGVVLSPETRGPAVERTGPTADAFDPDRPSARGILVLNGAGVAGGHSLGPVAAVDVAPTLAALLGLDAPAGAEGRPLAPALASPPR
jgi:hypothetical protein